MDSIRGSGDIPAMAESLILMQTDRLKNTDSNGNSTLILPILREDVSLGTFKVEWYDNLGGGIEFMYKEFDESVNKLQQARDSVIELFRKNDGWYLNKNEILSELDGNEIGKNNIGKAIKELNLERVLNQKQLSFDEYIELKNMGKVKGDYKVIEGKKSKAHFFYLEKNLLDNEVFNGDNIEEEMVDMNYEEFDEVFK